MTLIEDPTTETPSEKDASFVAPGRQGSLVEVRPRYDNFIGGTWVAPVKGQYMSNVSPVERQAVLRGGQIDARGRGAGP